MLTYMRKQLINCRRRTNKNFGFETLLCTLFFKRVPRISSRETIRGCNASFQALCRWEALLPQQGTTRLHEAFDDNFFDWWDHQIPMIEDYAYAGINFLRDPDIPMPLGEEHREIGKHIFFFFLIFKCYPFYGNVKVLTQ
jgi:hypothetical protein